MQAVKVETGTNSDAMIINQINSQGVNHRLGNESGVCISPSACKATQVEEGRRKMKVKVSIGYQSKTRQK